MKNVGHCVKEIKMEKPNYKKACEEAINSLEEEFSNGAKAMLNFIKREGTGCLGINCNCIICEAGNKFLRRLKHGKKETHIIKK